MLGEGKGDQPDPSLAESKDLTIPKALKYEPGKSGPDPIPSEQYQSEEVNINNALVPEIAAVRLGELNSRIKGYRNELNVIKNNGAEGVLELQEKIVEAVKARHFLRMTINQALTEQKLSKPSFIKLIEDEIADSKKAVEINQRDWAALNKAERSEDAQKLWEKKRKIIQRRQHIIEDLIELKNLVNKK